MKLTLLLVITLLSQGKTDVGKFWHISDHHLDFYYDETKPPKEVCPSSYDSPAIDPGKFGDYKCDSPWELINSSVYAMQLFEENPDFIVWTGDDTMHTADQFGDLSEETVIQTIGNITQLIQTVFPNIKVYPSVGNHDFLPKNQLSATGNTIIVQMAEMWKPWLTDEAYNSFKQNGYYWEYLDSDQKNIIMSLNTILWYKSNSLVDSFATDVANQFSWMKGILQEAVEKKRNVFIIGHIPPGYFELTEDAYWLYEARNKMYIDVIAKYYGVIKGQFFGHHHTDSFRLFKDGKDKIVSSMLLTPGVTPWMTNYPGVIDGANNPGIRLITYNKQNLDLFDYHQYYMDLGKANKQTDSTSNWALEYIATEAYNISDIMTSSWISVAEVLSAPKLNCSYENENSTECLKREETIYKYSLYNSVSYNSMPCGDICQRNHYCAITELDQDKHKLCLENWRSSACIVRLPKLIMLFVFLCCYFGIA